MVVDKYSANGNDFLITNRFHRDDYSEVAQKLCNRQNGIGADGLIILIPHEKYDFEWLFYNSDGSTAKMCGNGSRVAGHYAVRNNLAKNELDFLTGAGKIHCKVEGDFVTTDLTPPEILKKDINEFSFNWWLIDTGVPHLISLRDDISDFDLNIARELRYKYNANVNIAKIENGNLFVRTYERGVEDETLACGTGMASAYFRAFSENLLKGRVKTLPKSTDEVFLDYQNGTLKFSGNVRRLFFTEMIF